MPIPARFPLRNKDDLFFSGIVVYLQFILMYFVLGFTERRGSIFLLIHAGFPLSHNAVVFFVGLCYCVFVFVYVCICVYAYELSLAERRGSVFLPIPAAFLLSNKADGSHFVNLRHQTSTVVWSINNQHLS